ncbi:likely mitochondrial carrier protein [Moniliophthora roreri MCA 2997]|uniref:Likely mitochondrial carrier protein n=2 Tax=Moniliophthora roreri TaxID=221103 RepID=V2X236_MONRO|nr:likely mitochondrial carrier protein [Moniliophthora roreri MCA 2997]KAI3622401.1 putative mitochondrial carrier protein [Moniliophthora roreri]
MHPFHAKLVAAATGSTMTALTMTPFDVVKTRLQTQRPSPTPLLFPRPPQNMCCQPTHVPCVRNMSSLARPLAQEDLVCVWENGVFRTERVNGFFDAVRHVWRAEGIRGLWKGAGTTLVIGVPSSTSYMLTYDHLLNVTLPPLLPAAAVPLAAGVIARSAISTLVSPLELIRTNLQSTPLSADNPHTLRSVLRSIGGLAKEQGVLSLWRGLGPTLWRDVPFSGIYWAGYESCKRGFAKYNREGTWVAFVGGAVSGTSAALLTSPLDVVKTRRQALVMSSSGAAQLTSSLQLIKQIVRTEGVSALFAGLTPRIAKIAPACGIMIACFEGVGKFLSQK